MGRKKLSEQKKYQIKVDKKINKVGSKHSSKKTNIKVKNVTSKKLPSLNIKEPKKPKAKHYAIPKHLKGINTTLSYNGYKLKDFIDPKDYSEFSEFLENTTAVDWKEFYAPSDPKQIQQGRVRTDEDLENEKRMIQDAALEFYANKYYDDPDMYEEMRNRMLNNIEQVNRKKADKEAFDNLPKPMQQEIRKRAKEEKQRQRKVKKWSKIIKAAFK